MPLRNAEGLLESLRAIRRKPHFHELLALLGYDASARGYSAAGRSGSANCLAELERVAGTHPVTMSLALDAWEFEPASDDDDDGAGDGDVDHPQLELLALAEGTHEVFPAVTDKPDLLWDGEAERYALPPAVASEDEEDGDADVETPVGDTAEQLAALRSELRGMQRQAQLQREQHVALERDLDRRAYEQAVQLVKDSNAGLATVTLVAGRQSRNQVHHATAYELHPDFAVAPWDRTAAYSNTVRTFETKAGAHAPDFQQLLFRCDMRGEDHARMQKLSAVQPKFWRNPGKFSPTDQGFMGAKELQRDEDWQKE